MGNKTACGKAATALGKGWSSSSIVKWTNHQAGCIGGDGGTAASGTMYWNTKGDSNQSKGFPVCRYTTHSGTVTQWAQLPCPKGFFCKGGVRRKCATACSKGLTQITKCTASTDLTCAENPTCKFGSYCKGGTFLRAILPQCSSQTCKVQSECCSTCSSACPNGYFKSKACFALRDRQCTMCGADPAYYCAGARSGSRRLPVKKGRYSAGGSVFSVTLEGWSSGSSSSNEFVTGGSFVFRSARLDAAVAKKKPAGISNWYSTEMARLAFPPL